MANLCDWLVANATLMTMTDRQPVTNDNDPMVMTDSEQY